MVTVRRNPVGIESTYIDCLNTSFGHWGGPDMYRWCFERTVGSHTSDLLLLDMDGRPIAGSGITYRRVTLANDISIHAGIMTGSWTLPDFRQRGYFTRIIRESVVMAAEKGAALLLAFVTKSNASYRRLEEAGAALFPTYYLASPPGAPKHDCGALIHPVEDWQQSLDLIATRLEAKQAGHARVTYTPTQWRTQFLERPGKTEFLSIEDAGMAVIEVKEDAERLLFLLPHGDATFDVCVNALCNRAAMHGRQLLLFTTSHSWADTCVRSGFQQMDGYLAALVADDHNLGRALRGANAVPQLPHSFQSHPRAVECLGPWALQSGDRM